MQKVHYLLAFALGTLLAGSCALHAQTVPNNVGPTAATLPPALQNVGFEPPLNGHMPLEVHFRDESGRDVQLLEFFGQKPVVLAFVYYTCPILCDQDEMGVAGTLRMPSSNPRGDCPDLLISLDPPLTP